MSARIKQAMLNLSSINAKYANKKLLNFGELREVQLAQNDVLEALCAKALS
jgi:hypothetical protein